MTTYRIITEFNIYEVDVSGSYIVASRPPFPYLVNTEFTKFRDRVKVFGGTVVPIIEEKNEPKWLEHRGHLFEVHWNDSVITRISLHENGEVTDITFSQLPSALQHLLS